MRDSCCTLPPEDGDMKAYWNTNFESDNTQNWIEEGTPSIMKWIKNIDLPKNATIFCAGVGDAFLIDALLAEGYTNIIANDISDVALLKIQNRVNSNNVQYVQDDLINPEKIEQFHGEIDLYIDRATLHFFTACKEKDFYFEQMTKLLKPAGVSMLGVFSKENTPNCCGLDLQLWSFESLKNRLSDFNILDEYAETFTEQTGTIRNYIYLMTQKEVA